MAVDRLRRYLPGDELAGKIGAVAVAVKLMEDLKIPTTISKFS